MIRRYISKLINDERGESQSSVLLSLALFIILLAFFIVMNAVSNYSEEKTDGAFASLDYAFSSNLLSVKKSLHTDAENEPLPNDDASGGDSIEDIQNTLRSILPGLDMELTDNPNGGQIMSIRMKKDLFDRLSSRIIPVFVRILNLKDTQGEFALEIISNVRDTLSKNAGISFRVISKYRDDFIDSGIDQNRLLISLEKGNPAFMQFRFERAH